VVLARLLDWILLEENCGLTTVCVVFLEFYQARLRFSRVKVPKRINGGALLSECGVVFVQHTNRFEICGGIIRREQTTASINVDGDHYSYYEENIVPSYYLFT